MYEGEVFIDGEKCDVVIKPQLLSSYLVICNFSKRFPNERIFNPAGPHIKIIFRPDDFLSSITNGESIDLLKIREGLGIGTLSMYSGRLACETGEQTRFVSELYLNTEILDEKTVFRFKGKAGEITSIPPEEKNKKPESIGFDIWFELPDSKLDDFFQNSKLKIEFLNIIENLRS